MDDKKQKHELVGNSVVRGKGENGFTARCTCGWSSGSRFSGGAASAAFMGHQEEADVKPRSEWEY